MLSLQLRRCFASIGVRILLRARPKSAVARLSLRDDSRGSYVELLLPRLSRKTVEVLSLEPRRKRIVLRLTQRDEAAYFIVQGGDRPSLSKMPNDEAASLFSNGKRKMPIAA